MALRRLTPDEKRDLAFYAVVDLIHAEASLRLAAKGMRRLLKALEREQKKATHNP